MVQGDIKQLSKNPKNRQPVIFNERLPKAEAPLKTL